MKDNKYKWLSQKTNNEYSLFWCDCCFGFSIKCNKCKTISCSGSSCESCSDDFNFFYDTNLNVESYLEENEIQTIDKFFKIKELILISGNGGFDSVNIDYCQPFLSKYDKDSLNIPTGVNLSIEFKSLFTNLSKYFNFAQDFHINQKYGNKSYSYHLKSVAKKAFFLYKKYPKMVEGIDLNELLISSFFHDLVEDTSCTLKDIFDLTQNKKIVDAIILLTKLKENFDYQNYINNIKNNNLAKIVKIADTLCNLEESLKDNNYKFILKYSKQINLLTA